MSRWHRFLVYFGLRRPPRVYSGPPRIIDMDAAIRSFEPDTTPFQTLLFQLPPAGTKWLVDDPTRISWLEDHTVPSGAWDWGDWAWVG